MTRNLDKITKQISKKRGGKLNNLHVNSRDAQRLRRARGRQDKLGRILDAASRAEQSYVERVYWFKLAVAGSTGPLTDAETRILTESFLAREDEELAELEAQRRPGRPSGKPEDRINQRKDAELREFRGGFWVPELRDEESRSRLEKWSGDWSGMNNLRFVRVVKDGAIKPSSFPPKGLS